jgi:hypothetical protein
MTDSLQKLLYRSKKNIVNVNIMFLDIINYPVYSEHRRVLNIYIEVSSSHTFRSYLMSLIFKPALKK